MKQLAVPAAYTHIVLDAHRSIKSLSQLIAQTLLLVCVRVCVGASVCLILLGPTLSAGHSCASFSRSQTERERGGGWWEEEDADMKGGWVIWVFDVKVWSRPKENFKHCIELKRLPPLYTHTYTSFSARARAHTQTHNNYQWVTGQHALQRKTEKTKKTEIEREPLSAL